MTARTKAAQTNGPSSRGASSADPRQAPAATSFAEGMANSSPSAGAVPGPRSAGVELASKPAPAPKLRPAEQSFADALADGKGETMAFLQTVWEEPMDVLKITGEVFVEDELKSFVAGMDIANTVASLSPSKEVQAMTTFVTKPMANAVDMFAGVVVGDEDRVKEAMKDTVVEMATDVAMGEVADVAGIKTTDGRVAPTIINGDWGISKTAMETTKNNIVLNGIGTLLDSLGPSYDAD